MTFEYAEFKGLDWSNRWDDLRFPAQGINPPGSLVDADVESTTGMLLFAENRNEMVAGIAQMPHSWSEGSEIRPHIHWTPTDASAGDVLWKLEYQIKNVGEAFDFSTGWSELTVLDAASGTNGSHQIAPFGSIDMTGNRISCCISWRLTRMGEDESDTYAEDARVIEFDIHYLTDSMGSVHEFVKQGVDGISP